MWEPRIRHQYYFTYIMHEMYVSRFKIGFSSDPNERVKKEDRKLHGKLRGGPRLVELYQCWQFQTYPSAVYIEQMLIGQLRQLQFPEVEENNWFEIDPESLAFSVCALTPLIESIQRHETSAVLRSPARDPDRSYGKYHRNWLKSLSSVS